VDVKDLKVRFKLILTIMSGGYCKKESIQGAGQGCLLDSLKATDSLF